MAEELGRPVGEGNDQPGEGETYRCKPCRQTGMVHCAHPEECGNMRIVPIAAVRPEAPRG